MEVIDILNKWSKFINYGPEQTRFNLGSYWIHDRNKKIEKLSYYDDTGVLSLLYAKQLCKDVLMEYRPKSLLSLIEDPSDYKESKDMWKDFNSSFVTSIENTFKTRLNDIVDKVTEGKLIGEFKSEVSTEQLLSLMTVAIDGIEKCKYDIYAKGSCFKGNVSFNTFIHVFESTEDCLKAINVAKDAIYLCYIKMNDSAYGYFGFFGKDGDNIFSISERIDEKYPDQNSHKRNHRDAENKQYELFPYDYIFKYEGHDYKGYASKHIIDESNLAIFNLGVDAYLPIVIAMFLINKLYVGKVPTKKLSYVHSLVLKTKSIELLDNSNTTLMPIQRNTALAKTYESNILVSYDKEKFLNGEYSKEFNAKADDDSYMDYGTFNNEKQYLADLYGSNFDDSFLNVQNINSEQLLIGVSKENEKPLIQSMTEYEMIGSEKRIKMIHYWWTRKALAKHITNEMYKELDAFGGKEKVHTWYEKQIKDNIDNIYTVLAHIYGSQDGQFNELDKLITKQNLTYPEGQYPEYVMNKREKAYGSKFLCPINNTVVSVFFTFHPETWEHLGLILNQDVNTFPKIIKGWKQRHDYSGNSILDIIDPVSLLKHPLEEAFGTWSYDSNRVKFSFSIGFSKRGFIKMCKEHGVEPKKDWYDRKSGNRVHYC